jgi:hypothetical protein
VEIVKASIQDKIAFVQKNIQGLDLASEITQKYIVFLVLASEEHDQNSEKKIFIPSELQGTWQRHLHVHRNYYELLERLGWKNPETQKFLTQGEHSSYMLKMYSHFTANIYSHSIQVSNPSRLREQKVA